MFEKTEATMPSVISHPTPNPNSNTDASLYQNPDGLESQPAFQLDGAAASQSTTSTAFEHPAGKFGDETQHVVNTTSHPESIEPIQCEACNITCNSKDAFEKHTQGKKHMKSMQKIAISSVIGPKVTPPTASVASVGELENKKHMLLQNGASADKLLYCETCNVVCQNQDVFRTHLAGKRHSAKVNMQLASTSDVLNPTSNRNPQAQMNSDTMRCELCKISCTSTEILNTHMSGKKHLKKLKESGVTSLDTPTIKLMQNPASTVGKTVNSQEGKPVSCELCGIGCDTYEVLKKHLLGKKHQKNLEKSDKAIGPDPAPVMLQDQMKEEGKVVNVDGCNRKTKREGSNEDLEAKRRKVMESGAASDALRMCMVCNVVCSSPTVYISHLAGKKHAAMAVKQAEAGLTGQ